MKTVILAGGLGTRISEESHLRPKPMIEIGGMPMLWHIMKIYSHYGYNDFIVCLGYKQYMVKEFFADYFLHTSDVTFDLANNKMTVHNNTTEPWKVTLVDTGLKTMTGGRIEKIKEYIGNETFMLTYGDGVSDVDINKLVEYHKNHGKKMTITAINVGQQFGAMDVADDGTITAFREKQDMDGRVINGGYMVCEPSVFDYLHGPDTIFERDPMNKLSAEGQLMAYHHHGFWQNMDTQRDKMKLEEMWESGNAPWKLWE